MLQSNLDKFKETVSNYSYLFEPRKFEIILDNLLKTYSLQKPVFSIVLNNAENDSTAFIDCMNSYFFTEFDYNRVDRIFISRFKNYNKVVREFGKFEEVLRLLCGSSLEEIFNYCAKNTPEMVKLGSFNSDELMNDLQKFKKLFVNEDYKTVLSNIKRAFVLEKPLTGVELNAVKLNDITRKYIKTFIKCMEKYFFTEVFDYSESEDEFSGEIFISRFKRFIAAEVAYKKLEDEGYGEMIDWNGLIFGYSLPEIFAHCRKKNKDLVKGKVWNFT